MATNFRPHLSVLDRPQLALWNELTDVPPSFVLCGGTAVALHLGHRTSVDFDLFGSEEFDPDRLYASIQCLSESEVVQKAASSLSCLVDRGGPVKISFFGVPSLKIIQEPAIVPDNGLKVASLVDLAGMKAAVVQKRAEAKDYLDVDAILTSGGIDLPAALAAGKAIYGASFNPELTLKSLSYYGDGDLVELPEEVRQRLSAAVSVVDLDGLPDLG